MTQNNNASTKANPKPKLILTIGLSKVYIYSESTIQRFTQNVYLNRYKNVFLFPWNNFTIDRMIW